MRTTPATIEKFTGWKSTAFEDAVEDTDLTEAKNVFIDEEGVIRRRRGFSDSQSIPGPLGLRATILSRHDAINDVFLVSHSGGVSYVSLDGSTVTWTEASFAANARAAVQYNFNSYVFAYQTQQIMKIDASGNRTTNWANVQASHAIVHKGRIFTFNNEFLPASTIRYSQLFTDPTNPNWQGAGAWPASNTIDVSSGDGEWITGFAEYNDAIIIFKLTSTWILYTDGSPTTGWSLKKLHASIGSANQEIRSVGGLLYFQGLNAVYRTDGTTFEEISRPISDVWRTFQSLNPNYTNRRGITEWDGLLLINPQWEDDRLYVFNTRNDTWSWWEAPTNVSHLHTLPDQFGGPLVYISYHTSVGPTATMYTMRDSALYFDSDSQLPYESIISFRRQEFDASDQWKYVPQIELICSQQEFNVNLLLQVDIQCDFGGFSPLTRNVSFDSTKGYSPIFRVKGPGRCRYAEVTITTDSTGALNLRKLIYHLIKSTAVGKTRDNYN